VQGTATPLALLDLELDCDDDALGALERVLALRMLHALRAEDVVGRMDAGQFVCLLSGIPSRRAIERVAERLRAALEIPFDLGPRRAQVHAHIGIAVCPRDGATAGVLLKHADEAAFRARAHRSGLAFFDPRLDP
jgi:diguanylate cyclase (GGDEF)-like protein